MVHVESGHPVDFIRNHNYLILPGNCGESLQLFGGVGQASRVVWVGQDQNSCFGFDGLLADILELLSSHPPPVFILGLDFLDLLPEDPRLGDIRHPAGGFHNQAAVQCQAT